jgi:hypothetical protein
MLNQPKKLQHEVSTKSTATSHDQVSLNLFVKNMNVAHGRLGQKIAAILFY